MHFKISAKGKLEITKAEIDTLVLNQIPDLENLVLKSIDSLPQIYPAIKRGQPVTSVFTLPLIVKVSEY